jgi:anaerobic nitric oxide reductase flavorubredoxin
MPAVKIKPQVFWIGVNDRTTDLFEGLWPVSDGGVSYNTYLINDEKKVIIDLVKALKTDEFFDQIDEIMPLSAIDYVILNHMEPDHTGVLRTMKRIAPNVTILGSAKMKQMLEAYYGITENVRVVEDGETLSLGKRTLQFYDTPFVHWPETMMTYETADHILFSCDAFGSYGAFRGAIFDDDCKDQEFYCNEALRYYVNIVAKFSNPVLKAIKKLGSLDVKIIAPSHGLIWRKNPGCIVDYYKKWAEYALGETEPGVTLLYGSMYGNTEEIMNAVAQGVSSTGIPMEIFDVARTHVSYMLPSLWTKSGVIIGAPTYEGKLFPPMTQALDMAVLKRIQNKKASYFGSYGWSGGAYSQAQKIVEPVKWEWLDAFEFNGGVTVDRLKKAEAFGEKFAKAILEQQ